MYKLLTEGDVEKDNPDYPTLKEGDDWSLKVF
jgi:hypothetical protein